MKKTVKIIGLCGYAQVGKTTTAKEILRLTEDKYIGIILSFASPVKTLAYQFGWDGLKDERGRRLLQQIGTDVGRAYDPDIWVKKWKEDVEDLGPSVSLVVVDDVRFQNEVNAIRFMGGMTARIRCLDRELRYNHPSEKPEDLHVDFQITVGNEESPENIASRILRYSELHYQIEREVK